MVEYNVHFDLTDLAESSEGIRLAADYSFWIPLIDYFLEDADVFEIHCWEDEQAAVDEIINELPEVFSRKEGHSLIVSGDLTNEAKKFIRSHPLNKEGQLKWFSVFLSKKGKELFSSEHYGTEFIGFSLNQRQRDFFQQALPKETIIHEW